MEEPGLAGLELTGFGTWGQICNRRGRTAPGPVTGFVFTSVSFSVPELHRAEGWDRVFCVLGTRQGACYYEQMFYPSLPVKRFEGYHFT